MPPTPVDTRPVSWYGVTFFRGYDGAVLKEGFTRNLNSYDRQACGNGGVVRGAPAHGRICGALPASCADWPSMEWEALMVRLCNYGVRIGGRAEPEGSSR